MIHKVLKFTLVFVISLVGRFAFAMEEVLRDPSKLWEAKTEMVVPVATARVILADYELIRKDFPEIKNLSNEQIDQWLIRNTRKQPLTRLFKQARTSAKLIVLVNTAGPTFSWPIRVD
jgi:hypothetical protein